MEPPSAAFDALYRSCVGDLFAYVRTLLRDDSAAEDVTALAFERAYRKQDRFDAAKGTQRAWLFGIARNAALDELRKRGRTAPLDHEVPDDAGGSTDPVAAAERAARRASVRAAMEGLGARDRELIALKFFAGLTNAELAEVLGVSENNAGTKLHRAMTKLRSACDVTA
ncbi:MAG: sigma-70 family RNA polymerase sigma factor [Solirubrobacteraceae bacterium]|nr:sigma-70 family RNA polymerase sigma factor [Solirubrobacteraceae bacterium]